MRFVEIDIETKEGRLLVVAIGQLMGKYPGLTPPQILARLEILEVSRSSRWDRLVADIAAASQAVK